MDFYMNSAPSTPKNQHVVNRYANGFAPPRPTPNDIFPDDDVSALSVYAKFLNTSGLLQLTFVTAEPSSLTAWPCGQRHTMTRQIDLSAVPCRGEVGVPYIKYAFEGDIEARLFLDGNVELHVWAPRCILMFQLSPQLLARHTHESVKYLFMPC